MMISATNISKTYQNKTILSNVNFVLQKGAAIGILGPNGAGKTTLLKILSGLVFPTNGFVSFHGIERKMVATVIDENNFLNHISGWKNIKLFADTLFIKCVTTELFNFYGLSSVRRMKYKWYSAGMKQRLKLLAAIESNKKLFILDEITNTLDIEMIDFVSRRINDLKCSGRSFIISSHNISFLKKSAMSLYFCIMEELL